MCATKKTEWIICRLLCDVKKTIPNSYQTICRTHKHIHSGSWMNVIIPFFTGDGFLFRLPEIDTTTNLLESIKWKIYKIWRGKAFVDINSFKIEHAITSCVYIVISSKIFFSLEIYLCWFASCWFEEFYE